MTTEELQPLTLQFYLVGREETVPPPSPPSCLVSSETYLQSCPPHLLSALSCRTSLWQAAISFTAAAGVEAVRLSPESGHWTRDNFVLGSQLEHQLVWTGDCCTHSVTLQVKDIRGQEGHCGAGIQVGSADGSCGVNQLWSQWSFNIKVVGWWWWMKRAKTDAAPDLALSGDLLEQSL